MTDFITLAAATSSRSLFRHLTTATTETTTDEDDDFSKLYSTPSSSSSSASAASPLSANDSDGGGGGEAFDATASYTAGELPDQRPLLSPSAEAELFLLATNFLLYVAMVIIITMVAKIYFPESLERGSTTALMTRSISYVRVGSDLEDEDDNDEEEGGSGSSSDSYLGSDTEGNSEIDDKEEIEDDGMKGDGKKEEMKGLLLEMEASPVTTRKKTRRGRKRRKKNDPSVSKSSDSRNRSSSGGSFLEFDQTTTSRTSVLKRLAFCSLMLNATFIAWGVLQERMLTRKYPRGTGEYFTYSYALVFTNRFWTLIMSGLLWLYLKPRRSRSTVIYEYSFPSISNMLSSWCQYEALQYVSFPAVTLFKAFKLAPVMAMGKILGNKAYPQYDYIVALIIGIGITMFMTSSDDLRFGYDIYGEEASATWTGVMLLFLFLFFDSFTSQWQSRMFQRHRDLSMIELMFATSAFSTVLSFITLIHTKELGPALNFVYRHSEIHLHFFMFSICSTIGQLFIFYTIKNFGAVVFTIIMTTRILLSIALSCILYGHQVEAVGFLGLMLVMGAVCYRIKRKAEGKQLVKWQGMGDDKALELVQEWHEHVDT